MRNSQLRFALQGAGLRWREGVVNSCWKDRLDSGSRWKYSSNNWVDEKFISLLWSDPPNELIVRKGWIPKLGHCIDYSMFWDFEGAGSAFIFNLHPNIRISLPCLMMAPLPAVSSRIVLRFHCILSAWKDMYLVVFISFGPDLDPHCLNQVPHEILLLLQTPSKVWFNSNCESHCEENDSASVKFGR